jgi:UDP-GlcNAc:undecaprenyl-phosphate GlcNAc-1-phosphate transferase
VRFIAPLAEILPQLLVAFILAAVAALVVTPLVRRFAVRMRMVDRPGHRRINLRPVPRGGGLAVAMAFLLVALAFSILNEIFHFVRTPGVLEGGELIALFGGGAAAAGLGMLDDYLDLRARWQFGGQVALAVGAVALGISIVSIQNPVGGNMVFFPAPVAAVLTVLWIVGMINSVNFIDGLDGLSSGIGLIAAVTLGTLSLTTQVGQPYIAVLCFVLAGSLAGFLRWNFHPARIFAGTGGTMFLGYTLAVLAILGSAKVAVALLVLGIPIIDTFWIIVRRVVRGRSPFSPDRGHIHHRLLDLGLSHRQTVLVIYAVCIGLGGLSLVLSAENRLYAFIAVLLGSGAVLLAITRVGVDPDSGDSGGFDASAYDGSRKEPVGEREPSLR